MLATIAIGGNGHGYHRVHVATTRKPSSLARLACLCHGGELNAIVIETVRRRDDKLCPVAGGLAPGERNRTRWLIHNLHCRDRLSIRAARRTMLDSYGLPRSLAILHCDLINYQCPACYGEAPPG